MSVIYPGNYVTKLNAYREQGVAALPGLEFYRALGVYIVDGTASAGALALKVLSPDQRGDDKPRLDKTLSIPAGATIYRSAVNVENLKGTGAGTIQATGISNGAKVTAANGVFPADGAITAFDLSSKLTALGSATAVTATSSAALSLEAPTSTGAVIVEVCYWMNSAAPASEDVNLPYKIEAGQGS